jgi:hypothetical protein
MGKRFTIVIGVAAAGVMALGAQTAAAPADVVKCDTEVTISLDRWRLYHGEVKSKVGKCERERRVVLFKQRRGPDLKLGTDRTGEPGSPGDSWWIEIEARVPRSRHVYAKVRREVHDRFVCRADASGCDRCWE